MKNEIVSVITPVLNCSEYLRSCLDSVLSQNASFAEHILVDGGSMDGTLDIIRDYAQKFPERIRLVSGVDKGPGEAWNKGLALARGEIFGWLGADDTYAPGAINAIAEFFASHPEAVFVYGGENLIDEAGHILISFPPEEFNFDVLLNKRQIIPTTSAFYRRKVIETVGNVSGIIGNDLDLYLRIAKIFPVRRIESILSNHRVHGKSQTTGVSVHRRRMGLEAWYRASRSHGGRLFSIYGIKYYVFSAFGWALSLWNLIYFFILRKFKKSII